MNLAQHISKDVRSGMTCHLTFLVISSGSPAPHPLVHFLQGSYYLITGILCSQQLLVLRLATSWGRACLPVLFYTFSKFISLWFLNSITVFQTTVLWPNDDRLNCSSQRFLALRGRAASQSLLQKHRLRCWSSDLDQSCVTYFLWWFSLPATLKAAYGLEPCKHTCVLS